MFKWNERSQLIDRSLFDSVSCRCIWHRDHSPSSGDGMEFNILRNAKQNAPKYETKREKYIVSTVAEKCVRQNSRKVNSKSRRVRFDRVLFMAGYGTSENVKRRRKKGNRRIRNEMMSCKQLFAHIKYSFFFHRTGPK